MLTDEIAVAIAGFFQDMKGPTHDELDRQFRRVGLLQFGPATGSDGRPIGKMKRVRAVLLHALDSNPAAGAKLVEALVPCIKVSGGFRPDSPSYAGEDVITAAREAFRAAGYTLDPEGTLKRTVLENLDGVQATEALRVYIRRARVGTDDAALVVGTGKDLLEATARHVLVQATGTYPTNADFPTTLYLAFDRLGLATSHDMLKLLDADPERAIQQALYVLANAVNRLRNKEGTGHGRPFSAKVSDEQARIAIQAMGIISQALLDKSNKSGG